MVNVFNPVRFEAPANIPEDKSHFLACGIWHEEVNRRLSEPRQQGRHAILEFNRLTDCLRFTIRDQGEGFDWSRFLEFDPSRAFDTHGRGIPMARKLAFSSLEFKDKGNVVVVTVTIPEKNSHTRPQDH